METRTILSEIIGELRDELVHEAVEENTASQMGDKSAHDYKVSELGLKKIRSQLVLTQKQFAEMLGVSARTLQNWEQGRRHPNKAARVLLHLAARHPDTVRDIAHVMATEDE